MNCPQSGRSARKHMRVGVTVFAKTAQATATDATAMADHAHKETRCANATKEEATGSGHRFRPQVPTNAALNSLSFPAS